MKLPDKIADNAIRYICRNSKPTDNSTLKSFCLNKPFHAYFEKIFMIFFGGVSKHLSSVQTLSIF